MIQKDEDALICDFAETYHIYDYKRLPLTTVAALAVGLRDDSRIKMVMNEIPASPEIMLMAATLDSLNMLVWLHTKDAEKGINRPKSIIESLHPSESEVETYESGEDFMRVRERLINNTPQEVS